MLRTCTRLAVLSLFALAACGDDDDAPSADAAAGGPDSALAIDAPTGGPDAAGPCSAGNQHMIDPATGHCYMLFRGAQSKTWAEAGPFCAGMGAHLATVSSTEENALLASLLGFDLAWIGGSDLTTEGTFVWENGEPFTFTNWGDMQPNNGGATGEEDCLAFAGFSAGQWDDFNCTLPEFVFCEID